MSSSTAVKRPRPLVWWGIGLLLVALVGGVIAVIGILSRVAGTVVDVVGADSQATPLAIQLQLDERPYLVYELTGTSGSGEPFAIERGQALDVQPEDVEVTSSDGTSVPVGLGSYRETITRGSQTYTGVVRFDIAQEGVYEVQVRTPDTRVIVAPSLVDGLRGALRWLGLGAVATVVFLVGAVLLIVGLVTGHRSRAVGMPAGWYADPQRSATWRWWDGDSWTDQTG